MRETSEFLPMVSKRLVNIMPKRVNLRVGQTGRAGKTGVAITPLTPKERWRLRRIEDMMKQAVTPAVLPTAEEILDLREKQLVEQMLIWLRCNRCLRGREIVTELADQRYDMVEVSAVAPKLARAEEKQRLIAPLCELLEAGTRRNGRSDRRERRDSDRSDHASSWNGEATGSHEPGMIRLSLNAGRVNGVRVNQVVSALACSTDNPGSVIDKIKIHDRVTPVEVLQEYVGRVLAKAGSYRFGKQLASVQVA